MGLERIEPRPLFAPPVDYSGADHQLFFARQALSNELGLRIPSADTLRDVAEAFENDLREGLSGGKSSLRMRDTLLAPFDIATLPDNAKALVVAVGGTNIQAAMVEVQDKHLGIVSDSTSQRFNRAPLSTSQFASVGDFFAKIVDVVEPVSNGQRPDAFALIFSFDATSVQMPYGLDAMPGNMAKIKVEGIHGEPVGRRLASFLNLPESTPIVVPNDTASVLLSGGRIGVVVGTGFNIAIAVVRDGRCCIYNTESGDFGGIPSYALAEKYDKTTINPGIWLAEKQIAGAALAGQLKIALDFLREKSHFHMQQGSEITGESLTAILEADYDQIQRVFSGDLAQTEYGIMKMIAQRLRNRSAALVGTKIGAAVRAFPDSFSKSPVLISSEGSLLWGMPSYLEIVQRQANVTASRPDIEFPDIPRAGLLGAGGAALNLLTQ